MAAHGSEAVMFKGIPAVSDRGVLGSRSRVTPFLLAGIRSGTLVAIAFALLASFGMQALWAEGSPHKLVVQRSTRAIPHKFIVHPSEATVPVNETQRFEVTDADGNPVAVHWNVSGIGCSGQGCGSIDDQGVYRTPATLPQPRVVTVEGVLVSDPNYSVLTQVWLQDPAAASRKTGPGRVVAAKTQPLPIPEVGRESLAKNAPSFPLPNAIAAAPGVGKQIARNFVSPPLPDVVAPSPTVASSAGRHAQSAPAATVIAAAPEIGNATLARSTRPAPMPTVIAAAPEIGNQMFARGAGPAPMPNVVAPSPAVAPPVGRSNRARGAESVPLPTVVAAAPELGKPLPRKADASPLPSVIAPSPKVGKSKLGRGTESSMMLTVVASAPEITRQVARSAAAPPPANVVAPPPALESSIPVRSAPSAPAPTVVAATPDMTTQVARSAESAPLPNGVGPAPAVGRQNLAPGINAPGVDVTPLPTVVALATPATQIPSGRTQQLTSPAAGSPKAASSVLAPMPDAVAAVPAGTAAAPQRGAVVTYQNGQLTIDAENATLAAVLGLIAEKTGAQIDVPAGAGQERIFEHTGPGQANDVLEQLLNGSPFNFIIVSSPQHPDQPTQVLLSLHAPDANTPSTSVAVVQPAAVSNPGLWKPPAPADAPPAPVLSYAVDPHNMAPPTESLSPEALSQMMREKGKQILEDLRKQQGQPQGSQQ
jgi:hypothetical protein